MTTQPAVQGVQSTLSEWAGPYVTDMLGQGWALADQPYQAYQGPLTAGFTDNQTAAFEGIGGLTVPDSVSNASGNMEGLADTVAGYSYDPMATTTNRWDTDFANTYMNPYLETALNPVMDELQRRHDLARIADAERLTKAGAFGGSRQGVMEAEGRRNLMDEQSQVLTQGYRDAYDRAYDNFATDEARVMDANRLSQQDRQFGAGYGLDAASTAGDLYQAAGDRGLDELAAQMDILAEQERLGSIERAGNQEAVAADYAQWQQERDHPYNQLQFMQSLLQGLPVSARDTSYSDLSRLEQIISMSGMLGPLFGDLFGDGSGEPNSSANPNSGGGNNEGIPT